VVVVVVVIVEEEEEKHLWYPFTSQKFPKVHFFDQVMRKSVRSYKRP
jgi:hypothetical protein